VNATVPGDERLEATLAGMAGSYRGRGVRDRPGDVQGLGIVYITIVPQVDYTPINGKFNGFSGIYFLYIVIETEIAIQIERTGRVFPNSFG
jgi:hypothetical protein